MGPVPLSNGSATACRVRRRCFLYLTCCDDLSLASLVHSISVLNSEHIDYLTHGPSTGLFFYFVLKLGFYSASPAASDQYGMHVLVMMGVVFLICTSL